MRFRKEEVLMMARKIMLTLLLAVVGITYQAMGQISLGGDMEEIDYADPQKYQVGGITVSGVEYLDKNVLVMLSGITVGETINVPGEKISKAITKCALWQKK